VPNVGIRCLDRECQILAVEMPIFIEKAKETAPFICDKAAFFIIHAGDQLSCARIRTSTELPSERTTCRPVHGPPEPLFVFFPFTKCHISSIMTMPLSLFGSSGSGFRLSVLTHLRTAGVETPSSRAIFPIDTPQKLYSTIPKDFRPG
jgi:hypothetical protein